jgi:hypothetical protein
MSNERSCFKVHRQCLAFVLLVTMVLLMTRRQCWAQNDGGFISQWLDMCNETQANQPHWITPLATVTPRLEQEYRFDALRENTAIKPGGGGNPLWNIDNGKGLEIIPEQHTELLFNLPPYFVHDNPAPGTTPNGFGDVTFLGKYRLLSKNEEHGSYILTFFLGGSIPTGVYRNGSAAAVVTPYVAAGKGWGSFDVQSTLGGGLPVTNQSTVGHAIAWNTTAQYHVLHYFWPELEANSIFWKGGEYDGKKQAFMTPGLVFGRIHIHNRIGLTLGSGMQIAVTRYHQYNHALILTARLPF